MVIKLKFWDSYLAVAAWIPGIRILVVNVVLRSWRLYVGISRKYPRNAGFLSHALFVLPEADQASHT
jgi:hypothetical protein